MKQLYGRERIRKVTWLGDLRFQTFSIQFTVKENDLLTKELWSFELTINYA